MGGYVEEKDTYKTGTIFFLGDDETYYSLSSIEEMSIDNECSHDAEDSTVVYNFNSDPVTIEAKLCYVNKKIVNKILYGISNNYLRMHGGQALREHTRYNWYKRHKKKRKLLF